MYGSILRSGGDEEEAARCLCHTISDLGAAEYYERVLWNQTESLALLFPSLHECRQELRCLFACLKTVVPTTQGCSEGSGN